SLGFGPAAEEAGRAFARDLTGETSKKGFAVVGATPEARSGARTGTLDEARALAAVSPNVLATAGFAPDQANATLSDVAKRLGWARARGTFARRTAPGREEQPLLPTRVHLLFRGLPPLYACINRNCTSRRQATAETLLGRLYTEARTQCECGGRVYELLTHRD